MAKVEVLLPLIKSLWEQTLHSEVQLSDNFFALGGSSLLATQTIFRISAHLGVEPATVYEAMYGTPCLEAFVARLTDIDTFATNEVHHPGRMDPFGDTNISSLSYEQERLWFLDQMRAGDLSYSILSGLRIRSDISLMSLEAAWKRLLIRHAALRTRVASDAKGQSVQIVEEPAEFTLELSEHRGLTEEQQMYAIDRVFEEEASRPFDLAQNPLYRIRLLRFDDSDCVLFLTIHHIIADAWSVFIIARDLAALYQVEAYQALNPLPELKLQYHEFARKQRDRLVGLELRKLEEYWLKQLNGAPTSLQLPADKPSTANRTFQGTREVFGLSENLVSRLRKVAAEQQVTLFMVGLAAFALVLGRYSGLEDLLIGVPIANRGTPELADMVGFLVNTLVLRVDLSGAPTFRELLTRIRTASTGAFAHQEMPLSTLVERLRPVRVAERQPVFQVMLNAIDMKLFSEQIPAGWEVIFGRQKTSKFDLSLYLYDFGDSVKCEIEYAVELFEHATIIALVGHLEEALQAIATNVDAAISQFSPLKEIERRLLLEEWNGHVSEDTSECTICELFAEQVRSTPNSIAIQGEGSSLTYRQLDQRTNQLGRYLQSLGVGPETVVGVLLERSIEWIVAMLAVLKAGASYLPLDVDYPVGRLVQMMEDAEAHLVITSVEGRRKAPLDAGIREFLLIEHQEQIACQSSEAMERNVFSRNLAYVLFTSGSTGRPKGAMIEHAGLHNYMRGMRSVFRLAPTDNVLQVTSPSFDPSVREVLVTLCSGARLVLLENQNRGDPRSYAKAIQDGTISTILGITPSMIRLILDCIGIAPTPTSRLSLICPSGEPLDYELCDSMWRVFGRELRIVNLYGPTESTLTCCLFEVATGDTGGGRVPIGRPMDTAKVYIFDEHGGLSPIGVPGELYVGGSGVGRGYISKPGLSAERFVPDPFNAARRLYRTGDRVRWSSRGVLEYLGRIDFQLKIRGYRIEPGELEACLLEHERVRQALVIGREEASGEKLLVAYIIGAEEDPPEPGELRQHLKQRLPAYMIPSSFVFLRAFPLTPNGKIDRRALPAPEMRAISAYRPPATEEEEILCTLFAEVLGTTRVGLDDEFFALGGHSLMATRLVSRIRTVFGVELPIRALFESPTPGELRHRLRTVQRTKIPLRQEGRPTRIPLSYAQQRLWFLDRLEGCRSTEYNMPEALRLRGELDVSALERAVNTIVARHESLRTHFAEVDGEPLQVIDTKLRFELPVEDLSSLGEEHQQQRIEASAREEAAAPFDLSRGPVLRMRLLKLGPLEHILLRTFHHIASDGWSEGIFSRELSALYAAFCEGRENPLPPLPIQYADFALWQRRCLADGALDQGLAYWKQQLAGIPARLELPADHPRPAVQSFAARVHRATLSEELTTALKRVSQQQQATLYMTLLAAFAVLLSRYTGQDDIVVGSPIANRQEEQLESLIGFFVNTLVLRIRIDDGMSFQDLLAQVRRTTLDAYQHQDVPFERLVGELSPERSLNSTPLFQVLFALQNLRTESLQLNGLMIPVIERSSLLSKFDLQLYASETEGQINLSWLYSRDLFESWRIEEMATHYTHLLTAVAADTTRPLEASALLSPDEKRQILEGQNQTLQTKVTSTLPRLFDEQVTRTPDHIALIIENQRLSYAQLNAHANQLAHFLTPLGVGAESIVGIAIERSPELVIALLAILKTGAAYIPLDPQYPVERLRFMIEDAVPACVLTTGAIVSRLPTDNRYVVVDDPATLEAVSKESIHLSVGVDHAPHEDQAAYVMYTSGSTGRPKGVVISHAAIVNRLLWMQAAYGLDGSDRVLQKTSTSFDVSVWELFWPLITGATLVLAVPGGQKDPTYLVDLISSQSITTIHFVPSMLSSMLEHADLGKCHTLKRVICSGEALTPELQDRFRSTVDAELHNLYGPTEAAVDVSAWDCSIDTHLRTVPIGRPIWNIRIYVLDKRLEPVPTGVTGELWIAGIGLARGYLKQPGLTAERFMADPHGKQGSRMYRTGDLARWNRDGALEFLGRKDHQIKLRGFRIELGEIESALRQHPDVQDAVALVREDSPGQQRIIAYVIPVSSSLDTRSLRQYLEHKLPEPMIPSAFLLLDRFPLTASGKLDRKALAMPELRLTTEAFRAPTSPLEQRLCDLFTDVLGVKQVGLDGHFFRLGGHSLMATRLVSRVRNSFGVEVRIQTLFEHPTAGQLAEIVEDLLLRELEQMTEDEPAGSTTSEAGHSLK